MMSSTDSKKDLAAATPWYTSLWRLIVRIVAVLFGVYVRVLRLLVHVLVVISGLSVLTIMVVTCADVILRIPWIARWLDLSFIGAYDIVKIAGALSLAAALPYTTAVKGHVAIEYFYHKFNRTGRILLDSVMRLLGIALFAFLTWRSVLYGLAFRSNRQVSLTLELPIFWVPWFMGFCCGVVVLVIGYNLIRPGREMIKP